MQVVSTRFVDEYEDIEGDAEDGAKGTSDGGRLSGTGGADCCLVTKQQMGAAASLYSSSHAASLGTKTQQKEEKLI